jgi:FkbM family methyltransferase
MQTGKGEPFRRRPAFERIVSSAGRVLPQRVRCALRGRYERALARLAPDRLVCELPGGERIRLLPEFRQLTWNPDEYDAFRRDVHPGAVVFDVGANLGAYTMLFAQWAGETGRVVAFEPAADAVEGLAKLVASNGLESRVTIVRAAAGSAEGEAAFAGGGVDGSSRLVGDHDRRATTRVAITTIDAVCRRERVIPTLIKIDAEGTELEVLRGARETIAAAGAGLKLYVEMHPHLWADVGGMRSAIEAELAAQHLRAERLDGDPAIWNIEGVCLRLVPCGS